MSERLDVFLHLRLSASEREALREAAERDGRRVSDLARDALRTFLASGQQVDSEKG